MVGSWVGEHIKDWLEILLDSAPGKNKTEPENAATVPSKSNGAGGSTQTFGQGKIAKHDLTDLQEELKDLAECIGMHVL
jgi:hypothetical protein